MERPGLSRWNIRHYSWYFFWVCFLSGSHCFGDNSIRVDDVNELLGANEWIQWRKKLHTPLQTDRRSLSTRYSIHGTCDSVARQEPVECWLRSEHTHTYSKLWQIMQILVTCVMRMPNEASDKHMSMSLASTFIEKNYNTDMRRKCEWRQRMVTTMNAYLFNTQNQTEHEFYIWFQHMPLFLINGSRNCRLSSFPISSSAFPNPSYALWMHTFWH